MTEVTEYLRLAVENGAADIFFVAGSPASQRLNRRLSPLLEDKLLPADTERLISELYSLAKRPMDAYTKNGDDDFSFAIPGLARFRVSTYRQRGSLAAVIRVVAFNIPDWQELGIPQAVMDLSEVTSGLVLFTGTAGSGKSTTQACLIDRINKTRDCHIITLEDPIEFLHRNAKSIVSQREIAIDTTDYLSALRACLRQAPDVILLGEMRDAETIRTAMTAAETGHTVIATLHTKGTVNSIDRVVDAFPAEQQGQIRIQLASVLNTVVSQQLVPSVDGGLISAFEIMTSNNAVKNLIRDGKTHQLPATIASSSGDGMLSMDQSLLDLYAGGKITKETAIQYADNPEQIKRRLQ
ncbi:MAG: PilT/PilU family type 4a pilus ATPase [Ruminococcaceae bacterium]|nr:PilT/PilU family type 4a pilus ATPase [Oscillospiraceae bacterium]